jgi:hypothetical protein
MTKTRSDLVVVRDDRDGSGLGGVIYGYNTPRIHSPLNDLPSKGSELSQFATEIGLPLVAVAGVDRRNGAQGQARWTVETLEHLCRSSSSEWQIVR